MKLKIAFAGLRHGHIFSLYDKVLQNPALELVGVCEEDEAASLLATRPDIKLTDCDFDEMLRRSGCDIVAVGDYYAKRGSLAIRALKAGKHVIADKPLCTSLEELDEIETLVKQTGLKVGCMYELRGVPNFAAARELILSGALGKITQIQFGGQHPLMRGSRPAWYFEPGKHGGTINDIASHAIDIIPWLTGLEIQKTVAARTWQAFDSQCDCFNDAAQFMLTLNNGCGVLGDVSYSAPDSIGFAMPTYWRFDIWGTEGMIEFNCSEKHVKAYLKSRKDVSLIAPPSQAPVDYLESFLRDIAGKPTDLTTSVVLKSTRQTLEIQKVADQA